MKERLIRALRPLRIKLALERGLNRLCFGMAAGATCGAALLLISKFVYLPEAAIWASVLFACGLLGGVVTAVIRQPSLHDAARAGDALGYKERFTTALELFDRNQANTNATNALAVQDAADCAMRAQLAKEYHMHLPKRGLITAAACTVLLVLAAMMPSPYFTPDAIAARRALTQTAEAEITKLNEIKVAVTKDLSKADAAAVEKQLQALAKDLRKAKTADEQTQSIRQTQEALQKLADAAKNKDLQALAQALSQNEATKALAEALQNANAEKINEQLKALAEQLQNATDEERAALSDALQQALQQAAEALGDDTSLPLNDLLNALENQDLRAIENAANALAEAAMSAANEGADLQNAADTLNQALSQSSASVQNRSAQGQSQNQGEPRGQGQSSGQNQRGTQGDGQEQGEGQGSGQNSGQGQSASAEAQGQGQGQGSGRGTGSIDDERIFSREAQYYRDYDAQVTGEEGANGTVSQQEQIGFGAAGESVPYTEVYHAYRDEALRALDDGNIPHGMRELVKEYFSSLE